MPEIKFENNRIKTGNVGRDVTIGDGNSRNSTKFVLGICVVLAVMAAFAVRGALKATDGERTIEVQTPQEQAKND